MKNIFLPVFIIFSHILFSQAYTGISPYSLQGFAVRSSKISFLPNKKIEETIWTNDSIRSYYYDNNEWQYLLIDMVVNRDDRGNILNSISQQLDDTLNIWNTIKTNSFKYYEDAKIKEYLSRNWDYSLNYLEDTSIYEKFDQNNNIETLIYKYEMISSVDASSTMHNKEINFFNNQNKIKTKLIYRYSEDQNKWVINHKNSYNYNSNGKIAEVISFSYSIANNTWNKLTKVDYSYNAKGYLSESKRYLYNSGLFKWENRDYYLFKYDENGFKKEEIKKTYNDPANDWINEYRHQFEYDSNGKNLFSLRQSWNSSTNSWLNIDQSFHKYDSSGNKIYTKHQIWNQTSKEWQNTKKYIYFYNDVNQIVDILEYHWHKIDKLWMKSLETIFTYNQNRDIQSVVIRRWDSVKELWQNINKTESIYNSNNLLTTRIRTVWLDGKLAQKTKKVYFWNDFNYTNTSNFDNNSEIYISPNPAKDFITIHGIKTDKTINLNFWSENGNLLMSKNIDASTKINIAFLPVGIYLIQIYDNNKTIFRKIIKN